MKAEVLTLDEATNAKIHAMPGLLRWAKGLRAIFSSFRSPDANAVLTAGFYLNATATDKRAQLMLSHPDGRRLYDEDRTIDATTVDYDRLLAMPAGTLGHEYSHMMRRNGLSPDIFRAGARMSAEAYVLKRMRQCHDIWHTVAGYGVDVPGELEIHSFTHGQLRFPLYFVTMVLGIVRWVWVFPNLPLRILRAHRRGRRSATFLNVVWEDHWHRPLDEVRRELGITSRQGRPR